jgi:PIN domain nuclease of toxin-antitoxin system
MTGVVADTHALIWYLLDDSRLSLQAGAALDAATAAGHKIYLPTICIVEAIYLTEKQRIVEEALLLLDKVLVADDSPIQPIALTLDVAKAVQDIPRNSVPDLPDRVIAATAVVLGLPLITRDGRIRASGIETIW